MTHFLAFPRFVLWFLLNVVLNFFINFFLLFFVIWISPFISMLIPIITSLVYRGVKIFFEINYGYYTVRYTFSTAHSTIWGIMVSCRQHAVRNTAKHFSTSSESWISLNLHQKTDSLNLSFVACEVKQTSSKVSARGHYCHSRHK